MQELRIPVTQTALHSEKIVNFESTTTTALYIHSSAEEYGADADQLLATLDCESGLNPSAYGDASTSVGIAQIHLPAHPEISEAQALDPRFSIDWAARMFAAGKQGMWTCWQNLYEK